MKAKVSLIIVLALMAILAYGALGSGAWFLDQETSSGNTVVAGTLNLTTNGTDGTTQAYQVTDFKPGDWRNGGQIVVKNTGSLPGKLTLTFESVVDYENGCLEPEQNDVPVEYKDETCGPEEGELSQFVRMQGKINQSPWSTIDGMGDQTLASLVGRTFEVGVLQPDESLPIILQATWHQRYVTDHDNVVMSDGVEYLVTWKLEQIH